MPNSAKRARDRHAQKKTTIGQQIAAGRKKAVNKKKRKQSKQQCKKSA